MHNVHPQYGDEMGRTATLAQANPFQVIAIVVQTPDGRRVQMALPTPVAIPPAFIQNGRLLAGVGVPASMGQAPGFLNFVTSLIKTGASAFASDRAAKATAEAAEATAKARFAELEAARLRLQAQREREKEREEKETGEIIPGVPNVLTFLGGLGVVGTGLILIFG